MAERFKENLKTVLQNGHGFIGIMREIFRQSFIRQFNSIIQFILCFQVDIQDKCCSFSRNSMNLILLESPESEAKCLCCPPDSDKRAGPGIAFLAAKYV